MSDEKSDSNNQKNTLQMQKRKFYNEVSTVDNCQLANRRHHQTYMSCTSASCRLSSSDNTRTCQWHRIRIIFRGYTISLHTIWDALPCETAGDQWRSVAFPFSFWLCVLAGPAAGWGPERPAAQLVKKESPFPAGSFAAPQLNVSKMLNVTIFINVLCSIT